MNIMPRGKMHVSLAIDPAIMRSFVLSFSTVLFPSSFSPENSPAPPPGSCGGSNSLQDDPLWRYLRPNLMDLPTASPLPTTLGSKGTVAQECTAQRGVHCRGRAWLRQPPAPPPEVWHGPDWPRPGGRAAAGPHMECTPPLDTANPPSRR